MNILLDKFIVAQKLNKHKAFSRIFEFLNFWVFGSFGYVFYYVIDCVFGKLARRF